MKNKTVDRITYISMFDNNYFKLFLYYQNSDDYDSIILCKNYISSGYEFRKRFFEELEEVKKLNIQNKEDTCQMAIKECLKAGIKNIKIIIN